MKETYFCTGQYFRVDEWRVASQELGVFGMQLEFIHRNILFVYKNRTIIWCISSYVYIYSIKHPIRMSSICSLHVSVVRAHCWMCSSKRLARSSRRRCGPSLVFIPQVRAGLGAWGYFLSFVIEMHWKGLRQKKNWLVMTATELSS